MVCLNSFHIFLKNFNDTTDAVFSKHQKKFAQKPNGKLGFFGPHIPLLTWNEIKIMCNRCQGHPIWPLDYFVAYSFSEISSPIFLDCVYLSCHTRVIEWIYTLLLPEYQGTPCSKQVQHLKVKWLPRKYFS